MTFHQPLTRDTSFRISRMSQLTAPPCAGRLPQREQQRPPRRCGRASAPPVPHRPMLSNKNKQGHAWWCIRTPYFMTEPRCMCPRSRSVLPCNMCPGTLTSSTARSGSFSSCLHTALATMCTTFTHSRRWAPASADAHGEIGRSSMPAGCHSGSACAGWAHWSCGCHCPAAQAASTAGAPSASSPARNIHVM